MFANFWYWADALFMGPGLFARVGTAAGVPAGAIERLEGNHQDPHPYPQEAKSAVLDGQSLVASPAAVISPSSVLASAAPPSEFIAGTPTHPG